ncbi:MAG: DUF3089 domain-containing protein [Candidatus Binatia bacterium]|nr:DUF3089 domain-containing protein [Candidatus Binatia bacterium]
MRSIGILTVCALLAACGDGASTNSGFASAPTIFFADHESDIYEVDEHWLCRKDLPGDVCDTNLDSTEVQADGTLTAEPHVPASDPTFDCFYVYPTVRLGAEGNAPFDGNYKEEIFTVRNQAARFGRSCEMYAPIYRQRTLTAPAGSTSGQAYADVIDSFRYYLGHWNQGRPFMLIGHSQGAGHLRRLIQDEIDGNDALRAQMISAMILGSTVVVPAGEDIGGSFQNIPACRSVDQFNCVLSYASFRATAPPPDNSIFGRSREEGTQALCTNPAGLGGGLGDLTSYFNLFENSQFAVADPDRAWADDVVDPPAISTPFISFPGLVSSECVADDQFSYLSLVINPDPGPRADDVGGDLTPDWGMHIIDANVALGNLISIVERQADAWHAARR